MDSCPSRKPVVLDIKGIILRAPGDELWRLNMRRPYFPQIAKSTVTTVHTFTFADTWSSADLGAAVTGRAYAESRSCARRLAQAHGTRPRERPHRAPAEDYSRCSSDPGWGFGAADAGRADAQGMLIDAVAIDLAHALDHPHTRQFLPLLPDRSVQPLELAHPHVALGLDPTMLLLDCLEATQRHAAKAVLLALGKELPQACPLLPSRLRDGARLGAQGAVGTLFRQADSFQDRAQRRPGTRGTRLRASH